MSWNTTVRVQGFATMVLLCMGLAALTWSGIQSWHLRRAAALSAEAGVSTNALGSADASPSGTGLSGQVLSVYDATSYNSDWYVLDRRQDIIHRFDSTGARTTAFGRSGNGPGEFTSPEALAVYRDTLVVAEFDGTVHRLGLDGTFYGRTRLRVGSCLAIAVFDVVTVSEEPLYLVGCVGRGAMRQALVVQQTPEGSTKQLAAHTRGREGDRELDLEFLPVLGTHPSGFVFGSAFEDCLDVFDMDGHALDRVCHSWLPSAPLPDDWLKDREDMARSVEKAGMSIGELKAWASFDQMYGTASGRLVYRIPVPDRPDNHKLVVGGQTGRAVAVLDVEAPFLYLGDQAVLAAWDELDGTRIELHPWSMPGGP